MPDCDIVTVRRVGGYTSGVVELCDWRCAVSNHVETFRDVGLGSAVQPKLDLIAPSSPRMEHRQCVTLWWRTELCRSCTIREHF